MCHLTFTNVMSCSFCRIFESCLLLPLPFSCCWSSVMPVHSTAFNDHMDISDATVHEHYDTLERFTGESCEYIIVYSIHGNAVGMAIF